MAVISHRHKINSTWQVGFKNYSNWKSIISLLELHLAFKILLKIFVFHHHFIIWSITSKHCLCLAKWHDLWQCVRSMRKYWIRYYTFIEWSWRQHELCWKRRPSGRLSLQAEANILDISVLESYLTTDVARDSSH